MQNKTYLIGITGGSGAGKSTVSELFRRMGWHIIDADMTAREVQGTGMPCVAELCAEFGESIVAPDGSLKRRTLAALAFADERGRRRLNEITHKYIKAAAEAEAAMYEVCGIDAALLIESGMNKDCKYVIAVTAAKDRRIARIIARDGLTEEEANKRLAAQKDDEFYKESSDFIVSNDDTEEQLIWQIQQIKKTIESAESANAHRSVCL